MIGDLWPVVLVLSLLILAGFAFLVYELRRRAVAGLLPPERPRALPRSRQPGDVLRRTTGRAGVTGAAIALVGVVGVVALTVAIARLGLRPLEWLGAGLMLSAAVGYAALLLQRTWTRGRRGVVLLDLGPRRPRSRLLTAAVVEALLGFALALLLLLTGILRHASLARQVYMGASVGFCLSASLLCFFLAFSRLQACAAGVWLGGGLLKWDRLESYTWEEDVLWLRLRSRPSGGGQVGIVVAPEHREALESIVSARLPAAPARTEPA